MKSNFLFGHVVTGTTTTGLTNSPALTTPVAELVDYSTIDTKSLEGNGYEPPKDNSKLFMIISIVAVVAILISIIIF